MFRLVKKAFGARLLDLNDAKITFMKSVSVGKCGCCLIEFSQRTSVLID